VENQRAGNQVFQGCPWVLGRVQWTLGNGNITGLTNELRKLGVGHRVGIGPKSVNANLAYRGLLGIKVVRSHAKASAFDPNHRVANRLKHKGYLKRCALYFIPHPNRSVLFSQKHGDLAKKIKQASTPWNVGVRKFQLRV
jgi:hypothetical protein